MTSAADLEAELVGRIYDAVADPGCWPELLRLLARATDAVSASFCVADVSTGDVLDLTAHGLAAEAVFMYRNHFAKRDKWLADVGHRHVGAVYRSESILSADVLRETEFYAQFLRPLGIGHGCFGLVMRVEALAVVVAVYRDESGAAFARDDERLLRRLLPHFRRAAELRQRLTTAVSRERAARRALDRLPIGFVLVDRDARVLAMSRVAEEVVALKDGLSIQNGYLCAAFVAESQQLRERVLAAGRQASTDEPVALQVRRSSILRPLQLLVLGLAEPTEESPPGSALAPGAAAWVVVCDPERTHDRSLTMMADLYSLTAAEARLVTGLVNGQSLADMARRSGVSQETLRSHLKRAFEKTGTRRQADLIHFVLSGPALLGD